MAKPTKPDPESVRSALLASSRVSEVDLDKAWSVLQEMLTLFYPPFRAEDEDELLRQAAIGIRRYVTELGRFDRDTIDRAWGDVVSNHKTERWPTIGTIVEECRFRDPQVRTAGTFQPGEHRGHDRRQYPIKARPNYDYQVELGIMTREHADRMLADYDRRARGEEQDRGYKDMDTDDQREVALGTFRRVVSGLRADDN